MGLKVEFMSKRKQILCTKSARILNKFLILSFIIGKVIESLFLGFDWEHHD
jgi:hypothetical protein